MTWLWSLLQATLSLMHSYTHLLYLCILTLVCFSWAAASGQVSLNAMILPAALYFWQLPHFMALAYLCREDYAVGGYVLELFLMIEVELNHTYSVI